jgi:hypothetical protein
MRGNRQAEQGPAARRRPRPVEEPVEDLMPGRGDLDDPAVTPPQARGSIRGVIRAKTWTIPAGETCTIVRPVPCKLAL